MAERDRFSTRVFGLAVAALLAYLSFRIFEPFFAPIYWAFLLAFMLFGVNRWMRRAVRGRNGLAAALMTVAVALGVAIPAAVGAVAFARQAVELAHRLSAAAQLYQIAGVGDVLKIPVIGRGLDLLRDRFHVDTDQVRDWLIQGAQQAVQFLFARSRDVLFGAFGIFANVALTLFVLFFFFREGDALAAKLIRLIPFDADRKRRLNDHLQAVTRAVVFSTVVTAIIQGVLLGIGFWVTGVPSPLVFGVLAGVASFVPLVGTGLVWVPAVLYLWVQGVAWKTVFLLVWSAVVVGSADNVLRPLLASGKSRVGTLTVFFGVLGGLATFGFIGLFLGPVILALVLALLEFADEPPPGAAPASSP
ncbi:MAG TPA: AI-2E family transporter [Thermoanaerobaculia bacterium]|nr:AI-2E family transporter [Thermoanaerobaculia bacterium]